MVFWDGGRSRDRAGDDFGRTKRLLCARGQDQDGTDCEDTESLATSATRLQKIQRNDAAGAGLEKLSAKKNCPAGAARPSSRCPPCAARRDAQQRQARGTARRPRHSGLDRTAYDKAWPKTAGCSITSLRCRVAFCIYPRRAAAVSQQTAISDAWQVSCRQRPQMIGNQFPVAVADRRKGSPSRNSSSTNLKFLRSR